MRTPYDPTFHSMKKRFHERFDPEQASELLEQIIGDLAEAVETPAGGKVMAGDRD